MAKKTYSPILVGGWGSSPLSVHNHNWWQQQHHDWDKLYAHFQWRARLQNDHFCCLSRCPDVSSVFSSQFHIVTKAWTEDQTVLFSGFGNNKILWKIAMAIWTFLLTGKRSFEFQRGWFPEHFCLHSAAYSGAFAQMCDQLQMLLKTGPRISPIVCGIVSTKSNLPLPIGESPDSSVALVSRQDEGDVRLSSGLLLGPGVHRHLVVVLVRW